MTSFKHIASFVLIAVALLAPSAVSAQRQMENLGRGIVAINQGDGKIWVSWRLLGTDPEAITFNLYRATAGGGPVKLNEQPLGGPTFFVDAKADLTQINSYSVRSVLEGREVQAGGAFTVPANTPVRQYLSIPLRAPAGYTPNDGSVGDLDGDGEYEIVLHQTGRGHDNSQSGPTDPPILQAYKLDGTFLWEINLGKNIREGAHYTQFMVYDLDGDGRAEIVCKTADGTVDGVGTVIGDAKADYVVNEGAKDGFRPGYLMSGPEFLTVFDGPTGAALATVPYNPPRHPTKLNPTADEIKAVWGDGYGNRMDRFLACVAYLDGVHPSVVMCRGYYTRATLAAYDWREGKLTQRWFFDSDDGKPGHSAYHGQGNHNLSVADVDGDGKDEIVYGSAVIDDNGEGLYSTGWGHADAMHVTDHVPDNPGLEVFNIQERFSKEGVNMRDAKTGKPIFLIPSVKADTEGGDKGEGPGRGVAFNIDPRYPGSECWANGAQMEKVGILSAKGEKIADRPTDPRLPCNFAVWWDGDLLRELLDKSVISKWNWNTNKVDLLFTAEACSSNNGTKSTPVLSADLFGDWREEVIWRTTDNKELRIYTTTIPTKHRLFTLMHDPQYRLAVAWQNVVYNQPPHPSFYLDEAAPLPPRPNIKTKTSE